MFEHIILIEHISKDGSFYINSFLVDPFPKVGGHILGFNDISSQDGSWIYHNSKTPYFSTKNLLATCTFKFYGTRFWLTGIRHKEYSQCALYIDGIDRGTIDEKVNDFSIRQEMGAYGNQGILLYESDV